MSASCPSPFVPGSDYPERGGDTNSRVCVPLLSGGGTCCLPCPRQHWVYPDDFQRLVRYSTIVNFVGVGCCVFMLLSFAVLPVEFTHRHYLSVCLVLAIMLMQVSFIIPMGSSSTQCFDKITPHDMYSSINCALSGAFLLGGGWCTVMWVFLRTLSLHLQICWQVIPGRRFFLSAQAAGWSIPVVFLAVALSVTGVSFRFGESCHINSKAGLQTFWGPLLAVAAASIVTQSITFGYCIQVYLRSLMEEKEATELRSPLPYATSIRTVTAGQAFRRIQRVVLLQWRGIFVVVLILADVVFFATVFLQFDGTTEKTPENVKAGFGWLMCLLQNDGDKEKCYDVAAEVVIPEATALAVLFLLSFNGIWALILLGNFSILAGWYNFFKNIFVRKKPNDEFVSFNARCLSEPDPPYEMLDSLKTGKGQPPSTPGSFHPAVLKPGQDTSLSLSMPREYNPNTFSAQLRGRADSDAYSHSSKLRSESSFSSPPYTPFKDIEAAGRTPPAPYSPYKDGWARCIIGFFFPPPFSPILGAAWGMAVPYTFSLLFGGFLTSAISSVFCFP
ncbi:unnamed protein product [Tuber aestivum]|uniref:G-protein coupled receptors family 2 profile 2 domain-containing protein n=1 Tax=Tuber aestivum TaxID=59557 RepID=A0A292PWK7_9PEZI|nr:unnamed protein product [Tuber aestivum]